MSTYFSFKTLDGTIFVLRPATLQCSKTLKALIDHLPINNNYNVIPLPNVSSEVFGKIIKWAEYRLNNRINTKDKNDLLLNDIKFYFWEKNFLIACRPIIYQLLITAKYLNIQELLDSICKHLAQLIKYKSRREMQEILNMQRDKEGNRAENDCWIGIGRCLTPVKPKLKAIQIN